MIFFQLNIYLCYYLKVSVKNRIKIRNRFSLLLVKLVNRTGIEKIKRLYVYILMLAADQINDDIV